MASPTATPIPGSTPPQPFRRLLKLVRPDRGELLAVTAFGVAIGVLSLAVPVAVQSVVNFVALGGVIPPLIVVVLLLLLGLGAAAVFIAFQRWTVEILQRRLFVRLVADLAERLPRVPAFQDGYNPELVNRFFDVITIQKVGSLLLLDGLALLLSVLVGLVVLAFYHPLLLAFDLVLLTIITLIVFGPLKRGTRTAIQESKAKYATQGWFEQVAANPHLFRTAGSGDWVREEVDRRAMGYLDARRAHFRVVFGQSVAALGLQVLASAGLLGIGGFLVISGALTLGQLVAAELIVTLVVSSVAKLGKHLENYYDLMAATDKVGQLLDLPMESDAGEQRDEPADPRGAALSVRDLHWQRHDGRELFGGLSVDVAPGQSLVVVGPSGSGKTVLADILWGLRRPARGVIQVDGRDLRELAPGSARRLISVAGPMEFCEASVYANIQLGRSFVSRDDVREAVRLAGLEDSLSRLPDGMETTLRLDGAPLSSGQRRRLVLARALAGRPSLLVVKDLLDPMIPAERERVLRELTDADAPWTLVLLSTLDELAGRGDAALRLGAPDGSRDPAEEDAS